MRTRRSDAKGDPLADQHEDWMAVRGAQNLIRKRRFKRAGEKLEQVVKTSPRFDLARSLLAHVKQQSGDREGAIEHFSRIESFSDVPNEVVQGYADLLCQRRDWIRLDDLRDATDVLSEWVSLRGETAPSKALRAAFAEVAPSGDPRPGVFLHLPFCAGTSMGIGLKRAFGPALWTVPRKLGRKELIPFVESGGRSRSPAYVRLHHPYPLNRLAQFDWVTVLRDPKSRFLSAFSKRLVPYRLPTRDFVHRPSLEATITNAEREGLANTMSRELAILSPKIGRRFDGWLQRDLPSTARFEEDLYYLEATKDLSDDELRAVALDVIGEFRVVGLVEEMMATYLLVFASAGVAVVPPIPHEGRSERDKLVPTDDQLARIDSLHTVDDEVYATARERFHHEHRRVLDELGRT